MKKIRGLHSSNGRIPDKWLQELINVINSADSEVDDSVDKAIKKLIGAAPSTLDTLEELAEAIQNDDSIISTLNQLIGNTDNLPYESTNVVDCLISLYNEVNGLADDLSDVLDGVETEIIPNDDDYVVIDDPDPGIPDDPEYT